MDLGEYQQNLDAFNNAKEQLSNLVDEGRNLISGKTSIQDKIATVLQTGGDVGGQVLGGLGAIAEITKGTALEKTIGSLKDQLSSLRQNVSEGIQKGVESGINKATDAARNLAGDNPTINSMIDSASSSTRQTLNTAISQASGGDMSGALNTMSTGGSQALTTGSQAIKSGVKQATDLVEDGTKAASDAVANTTTSVNQTLAMAGNSGAKAVSNLTGNLSDIPVANIKNVAKTLSKKVKGPKQAAKQTKTTEESADTPTNTVPTRLPGQQTPLGKALGDEDIANLVREQVKSGTVDADTLRVVKEVEPDLLKQAPQSSTATQPSTAALETTPPPPPPPAEQAPGFELPDLPGLSDMPRISVPELPDLPGLSDVFGLVPKTTLAEAQGAAASLVPKVGSAEATVSELGGAMGKLSETVSAVSQTTAKGLTKAPSKVLGIVNKGQRGDSTLARALGRTKTNKPAAPPSEPARPVSTEEIKMPTMEDIQNIRFSDPSETVLTKYLPQGDFGDLEAYYAATGIPKEVLAQARAAEPGGSLVQPRQVMSSDFDNTIPQSRITAPEPSTQPKELPSTQTTATPNNPSIKPQTPSEPAPSQAVKVAPKSEIEPAIGPEPAPSTVGATSSTPAVAPSQPISSLPKPTGGVAAPSTAAEGGEAVEAGETILEGGAAIGPEGLLAGAIVAGISSLIGGLIKDFEPSKPSIPTFANTGVSFSGQQQLGSGTAF